MRLSLKAICVYNLFLYELINSNFLCHSTIMLSVLFSAYVLQSQRVVSTKSHGWTLKIVRPKN